MAGKECENCPAKELQRIHRLVEKKALEKLPAEVREPLLEAKRQMRLVLRGFIGHALGEREVCHIKHPPELRHIELE